MELAFKKQGFIIYKLIPCLIITMFSFMCLYGSFVYADSEPPYTYTLSNDTTITLQSLPELAYDGFVIIATSASKSTPAQYYIFNYNTSACDKIAIYPNSSNDSRYFYKVVCLDSSGNDVQCANCYVTSQSDTYSWSFSAWGNNTSQFTCSGDNVQGIYSNNDIYLANNFYTPISTSDTLVFQAPLQTQPTIVASQVGEVEMNKTLQEILGILPVVIVVLVGLIALRKAIQFLMARMRKA